MSTSKPIQIGQPIVFGIHSPLPLRGFPPGKVRLRLRNQEFARAFIKNGPEFVACYIEAKGGNWQPGPRIRASIRTKTDDQGEAARDEAGHVIAHA